MTQPFQVSAFCTELKALGLHPLPWQKKDGTFVDANGEYIFFFKEDADRILASVNMLKKFEVHELEGRSFEEFVSEQAFLSGVESTKEGAMMGLHGSAAAMVMANFAGMFTGSGAINFLEIQGRHESTGPLTITIQRCEGLTPAQKLAAAEARAGQLAAKRHERATHQTEGDPL